TIFGTVSGDQLSMDCSADDGTTFQMTGSVNGSQELRLTRSDLPGQVLTFTRISESRGRGEISFFLDGLSGTKGRVVLGSDPVSTTTIGNQTVREYRGTWLGVPVNFWSYSTGVSSVVVYNDPLCVTTLYLTNYSPADFTSKTATAVNGSMTVYNTTLKTQIRFKTLPTVSP
ncbi:MAG TPA: hypothetical protein VFT74_17170, partial [Isosphaeraceae bacterium]|nr:hypothetical protein [Isosphaeraceae bacterium]